MIRWMEPCSSLQKYLGFLFKNKKIIYNENNEKKKLRHLTFHAPCLNKDLTPRYSTPAESLLFPLLFFFWIKAGTRISVGEIFQRRHLQTHSRSLPQHVAQHWRSSTLKNKTNGIQRGMTEPLVPSNQLWFPSVTSSSSSNDGLCKHTPHTP